MKYGAALNVDLRNYHNVGEQCRVYLQFDVQLRAKNKCILQQETDCPFIISN